MSILLELIKESLVLFEIEIEIEISDKTEFPVQYILELLKS